MCSMGETFQNIINVPMTRLKPKVHNDANPTQHHLTRFKVLYKVRVYVAFNKICSQ